MGAALLRLCATDLAASTSQIAAFAQIAMSILVILRMASAASKRIVRHFLIFSEAYPLGTLLEQQGGRAGTVPTLVSARWHS
jgi:hypothetical protein